LDHTQFSLIDISETGAETQVHDETPRNQWKLGVIIQLNQGKDGLVRSVTLRTAKGNLISRPIEKLYPLQVLADEGHLQDSKEPWRNKVDHNELLLNELLLNKLH